MEGSKDEASLRKLGITAPIECIHSSRSLPEIVGGYDEVVVATGVHPRVPDIPGMDHPSVLSYIEVLDSQRQLFDAELIYTQTQGLVFASIVATYKALGGGWVSDAEAVANEVDFPPEEKEKK